MSMEYDSEDINRVGRIRETRLYAGVRSHSEFASILNRERDRADRTGQGFSLVVFELGADGNNSAFERLLVPILTNRVRSTDDIGWLENGRLGVVLPHTTPDSAWKFVGNVRHALNGGSAPIECIVYAYPSSWPPRPDETPPDDPRSRRREPSRGDPGGSVMHFSDVGIAKAARPVEELESEFLCRIPFWKRAVDVAGSFFALILLAPLFLLVAIFIKVVSPGPVFFRQERMGYLGKVFTIWKFRTMHVNADATIHKEYLRELINNEKSMIKLDNGRDNRIIPLGGFLRAAGIDELPQLFNVLLGDMSLVGPRPCIPYEASEFDPWQMRRFDAVPGLTGLWQVSGKNKTTFKQMMRLDIAYAKKRAFLMDMKIFLKTLPAVVEQVADRPRPYAQSRSKVLEAVTRLYGVILAIVTLGRFGR
jgi:lipopolysaccharide/colanic/teichoic acid biosynthesis glycosyltransferase